MLPIRGISVLDSATRVEIYLLRRGSKQWDFSLTKEIQIREVALVSSFRFEAFNCSKSSELSCLRRVRCADNWPPSAKLTAARTMREMQFGVKYNF